MEKQKMNNVKTLNTKCPASEMMNEVKRVRTQRQKTILKNGTVKIYVYTRPSQIQEKTKILMALREDETVIEILKNKDIKRPEKVDNIFNLIKTKPDLNKLSLTQIKNFVYRNA